MVRFDKNGRYIPINEQNDSVDERINNFFKENPSPTDSKVHALADELGLDPSVLEQKIYSLYSKSLNK